MTNSDLCKVAPSLEEAMQTVICTASSFSYLSLLGPLVLAVSVLIAVVGLVSARAMARKRATLDLIEKVESTPHYRHLQTTFAYYKKTDAFDRLHNPEEDKDRRDRSAVQDYLSHYELVSIGIEKKILDYQFYHDWMANPFVRDWNAAADFIQRERWKWDDKKSQWEYYDRLFEAYGRVASRFSNEALKLDENYKPHPPTPSGPGDKSLPSLNT